MPGGNRWHTQLALAAATGDRGQTESRPPAAAGHPSAHGHDAVAARLTSRLGRCGNGVPYWQTSHSDERRRGLLGLEREEMRVQRGFVNQDVLIRKFYYVQRFLIPIKK